MYPSVPPPPPLPGVPKRTEQELPEASPMIMFLNVTNTITHLLLGAAAACSFVVANAFTIRNSISTHIYMCTFGYVILLAVGFLAFDPSSNLRRSLQYPKKKLSHLVLQVIGSTIAIAGSLIIIVDNPWNFETTHGILGLVAMILTFLSLFGGVVNFLSSTENNKALITTLHSCFGTVTIIIAFVTLCLGFDYTYFLIGDNNVYFAIAVTSIGLVGFVLPPVINFPNRLRK